MTQKRNTRVHGDAMLVGSLPFANAEEALRAGAEGLQGHAFALPDGEFGPRWQWVGYLREMVYSGHPQLEEFGKPEGGQMGQPDRNVDHEEGARGGEMEWCFKIKPGETLRFEDAKYGQIAIDSYKEFVKLREAGVIEPGVRFQVGLPGPSSAINSFFPDVSQWPEAHRAYVEGLKGEIGKMLTEIPADDLAIQFDCTWEVVDVSMGDRNYIPFWPDLTPAEKFAAHMQYFPDLAAAVPDEALLGFHWCYGTYGGWPMTEMRDLGVCVDYCNAVVREVTRTVDYIHVPVVKHPEDAFFAPLDDLDIGGTKMFLGLIHTDGLEGFKERYELAHRHLDAFGVASVCGFGRSDLSEVPGIMQLHHDCASLLPGADTSIGSSAKA